MSTPYPTQQGEGYPQPAGYGAYPPPGPNQYPPPGANQYPPQGSNPYAPTEMPMNQYYPPNQQGNFSFSFHIILKLL